MKKTIVIYLIMCTVICTQCINSDSEEELDILSTSSSNRSSIISIDVDENNQLGKSLTLPEIVEHEANKNLSKITSHDKKICNKIVNLVLGGKRKIDQIDLTQQGMSQKRAKLLADALNKYNLEQVIFIPKDY